jgi:hypothetical protein
MSNYLPEIFYLLLLSNFSSLLGKLATDMEKLSSDSLRPGVILDYFRPSQYSNDATKALLITELKQFIEKTKKTKVDEEEPIGEEGHARELQLEPQHDNQLESDQGKEGSDDSGGVEEGSTPPPPKISIINVFKHKKCNFADNPATTGRFIVIRDITAAAAVVVEDENNDDDVSCQNPTTTTVVAREQHSRVPVVVKVIHFIFLLNTATKNQKNTPFRITASGRRRRTACSICCFISGVLSH